MSKEKAMLVMRLHSGKDFNPLEPDKEDIDIKDIAHALSLMCRGNGQIKHFYSVGQHSINCAMLARDLGYTKRVQMACLLHDASEAYIADITRPVKRHLKDYLLIEEKLQEFLYRHFGLEGLSLDERAKIKEVDDTMLRYELHQLLAIEEFEGKYPKDFNYPLSFTMMEQVEEEFLQMFKSLQGEI